MTIHGCCKLSRQATPPRDEWEQGLPTIGRTLALSRRSERRRSFGWQVAAHQKLTGTLLPQTQPPSSRTRTRNNCTFRQVDMWPQLLHWREVRNQRNTTKRSTSRRKTASCRSLKTIWYRGVTMTMANATHANENRIMGLRGSGGGAFGKMVEFVRKRMYETIRISSRCLIAHVSWIPTIPEKRT